MMLSPQFKNNVTKGLRAFTGLAVAGGLGAAALHPTPQPMGGWVGSQSQVADRAHYDNHERPNVATLNRAQFPQYSPTDAAPPHPGAYPQAQLMVDQQNKSHVVKPGYKPTPGAEWIVGNKW
jgi:hypothetical protein